jgi:Putative zinc-finger
LFTCKQFLQELNDYLDAKVAIELKRGIESHISECQKCFGVVDTIRITIKLCKGVEPEPLPVGVKTRLLKALERKVARDKQVQSQTTARLWL